MLKLFSAIALVCFTLPVFAATSEINLVDQLSEGGVALVVILALSILFVAVSAERLINFRQKYIFSDDLLAQVKHLWVTGEFEKIHELLDAQNNTLARTLGFIVNNRHQTFEFISNGAGEIASLELRQHQQKAYALAIVATVAPIVGLLGTVIGMIEAFHVIAYSQGMGNPALLAGGISKALINTAAGLSVALPALGMHHFLKHRSALFGLVLEKNINQLINQWFLHSFSGHPTPAAQAAKASNLDTVIYAN
jgi:biopolymer transport protein ExbB